jgi:hypothetical protein
MHSALFKDEAEGTRSVTFWACVAITFGLALVSLYGVWAEDGQSLDAGIFIGKCFWSVAVVGAEFLAAMALQRAIIAPSLPQKIGGVIVFVGLAWFCVHNVERGVHKMYPTIFTADAQELRELAQLANTQAGTINTAADTAIKSIPEQLAGKRTELAKLEAELKLITGDGTEASIKRAQSHLQGLTYYDGAIDGLWEDKTKGAVLRRGNEIRSEMEVTRGVIKQLETGAPVTTTATASDDQSKTSISRSGEARKREEFGNQIAVGAWVLEGARSLGWIVFLSSMTLAGVSNNRKREAELDDIRHENEKARLLAERVAVPTVQAPTPVEAPPVEVPPAPEPEPFVLDEPLPPAPLPEPEKPIPGRAGGLGAQHINRASKLENVILVDDNRERNAAREAMKVAAE